jgi:First Longin domain of INTU, CCZ1 and HPS4
LFYYPEHGDNNEKLKDVGFIEAIVKFTNSFSFEESNDVMTMKTLKTMKLFYEPEKNFWIVLVSALQV